MNSDPSAVATDILHGVGPDGVEAGRILLGKYHVLKRLGRGGMGEVWLVRHLELGVERVVKLILAGQHRDHPQSRERFRREGQKAAALNHPHVVIVHDAGLSEDKSLAYIEMEYIRGQSLLKLLKPGAPMPLDWVGRILGQLCDGLEAVHASRIVHRDLKPSNLMLVDGYPAGQEHLKIVDFGLAKVPGDAPLTAPNSCPGTPGYMSPEQVAGGPVDGRSDLYSVGIILYEFVTGRLPFDGIPLYQMHQHAHAPRRRSRRGRLGSVCPPRSSGSCCAAWPRILATATNPRASWPRPSRGRIVRAGSSSIVPRGRRRGRNPS